MNVTPSEIVSGIIAKKLQDSLGLTQNQKNQVYTINMLLHQQKIDIRQQHPQSYSLDRLFQKVENTRDSLYRTVLQEEKYLLYLQKKAWLIGID